MIQLSPKPDAADLTFFWVSLSTAVVAAVGFATYPSILPTLILAALATVIGFRFPPVIKGAYHLWRVLILYYVRLSRFWSLGVCFYLILGITGSTRANLLLQRPPANFSMWALWKTPEAVLYSRPVEISKSHSKNGYWFTSFLDWASHPRHVWAYSLLPFVILLRLIEGQQQKQFPSNIYTLY